MIVPSHHSLSSVPPFHPLGNGTVEHGLSQRNTPWNVNGTISLKTLENKVLEMNKERNNSFNSCSTCLPKSLCVWNKRPRSL